MYASGGGAAVVPKAPTAVRSVSIELAVAPTAVRRARHWTADQLAHAEPPYSRDLIDNAVLLVSELVTNAVQACGPQLDLVHRPGETAQVSLLITRLRRMIRIEVHDSAGGTVPVPRRSSADAETGRGLTVVAALTDRWGWQPAPYGKIVWCELSG